MVGFLLRALIVAAGLWVADRLLPGISIQGPATFLLGGALLGLANAVIRPIVVLFTLPLTIVTLGLFLFVVNAAMVALVAAMLPGFRVAGFFSALLCSLVVSVVSGVASWFVGSRGRYEILVVRRNEA
ncbi:MAG TPA: phage holin family protein [Myxococcota bacterium]|nr:phage holin family protein [Myxococcota bacterium]